MEHIKIDLKHFFVLFVIIISANASLIGLLFSDLEQDYLISNVIGFGLSIVLFYLYYLLYKRRGFPPFDELVEGLVGRLLGKIILFVFAIYFLFSMALDVRGISEIVNEYYFNNAKIYVTTLLILLVIIYAAISGLEVMVRVSNYVFIGTSTVFLLFVVLLFIFNKIDFGHFIPFFDRDISDILTTGLMTAYALPYGVFFIITFIFTQVKSKEKLFKVGAFAQLWAGLMMIIVLILNLLIIDPILMPVTLSPALSVTRRIDVKNFIQRLDLITLGIHLSLTILRDALFLYGAQYCISRIIPIKKRYMTYFVFGIILYFFTIFYTKNYIHTLKMGETLIIPYVIPIFEVYLPLLLLFLSFIKKEKRKTK